MGCCDACGNVARFIIVGLTVLGIILQSLAASSCGFLKYSNDGVPGKFGLFRVPTENGCTNFKYSEIDSEIQQTNDKMLEGARAMVILAILLAFAAGTSITLQWLFCNIPCTGCLEGIVYSLANVCTCLVYIAYGSQYCIDAGFQCSFGQGATYNLLALACYIAASIVHCCSPKPDPILKQCCC